MTCANPNLLSATSQSWEMIVGRTDARQASDLSEAATIKAADRRAMDGGCTEAVRYGALSGLIGCALAQELRGEVRILFEPEGVTCVIDAPLPPMRAEQLEIAA